MKSLQIIALSAGLLAGQGLSASADVVIKLTRMDLSEEKPVATAGQMMLGSDRLLMKWEGEDESEMSHTIFRGDRQLLWTLDDKNRKYMEITREAMAETGKQVGAAMEKMKAELDKMTPEQRKIVEGMMKGGPAMGGGGSGATKPERKTTKTGESKTISGFPCTKYEVFVDGEKEADVWATPFAKTGLRESDFAVFKQCMSFFDALMSQVKLGDGSSGMLIAADPSAINGVPIRTVDYDHDGKPSSEMIFDSITRGEVPAASYDLPAGYEKKEMFKKSK